MNKLIVCLGHALKPDASIPAVLANRLDAAIGLMDEDPQAGLLVMGGPSYRDTIHGFHTEAAVTRAYLAARLHAEALRRVMVEATVAGALDELGWLRRALEEGALPGLTTQTQLVIVTSEGMTERVRLYIDYLLLKPSNVRVVAAKVPEAELQSLRLQEADKLARAKQLLAEYKPGDYKAILSHEQAWQRLVINEGALPPASTDT